MITLTSCLLVCLISAENYVAASQTVSSTRPEAWPPQSVWNSMSAGWPPQGAPAGKQPHGSIKVPGPKLLNPYQFRNVNPYGSNDSPEKSQTHNQVKPKSFSIHLEAPTSITKDGEHGYDPYQSHMESSNYPHNNPQGASKLDLHLNLDLPFPTTTLPPSTTSAVNVVNAEFLYSGPSQNHYLPNAYQEPEVNKDYPDYRKPLEKPTQSKFVSFFRDLLGQRGQSHQNVKTNTQQDKVFYKPMRTQHSSHGQSGSHSSPHGPNNVWTGHVHLSGSTDAGSGSQTPVHQAVQNTRHYPPQWYHAHGALTDAVKKGVLQSVQYVNGQLMIPLEKCPGFAYLAAALNSHHGYVHHHSLPFHSHFHHHVPYSPGHGHHHGPLYHSHYHRNPSHVHHHGPLFHSRHSRPPFQVHHHGMSTDQMQTKPSYAQFFLNAQGPEQPQNTNVQLSGVYQEKPFRRWQDSFAEQHRHSRPPQSNYMVHAGANVEYDKRPETLRHSYLVPQGQN